MSKLSLVSIGGYVAKVIDFPKRVLNFTHNKSNELNSTEETQPSQNLVDLTSFIKEQGAADRRKVQRVVLGHLIASHVVLPNLGLVQVTIRDVDETGLAFEMESFLGRFSKGDQVELRFYLNGQTYFRVHVEVAYSSIDEQSGQARHGSRYTEESLNQEALLHFIQFLRSVSVSLQTDRGERVVSNLTS